MSAQGKIGVAGGGLLRLENYLTRTAPLGGLRVQVGNGGRAGGVYCRGRWSHDRVVRSTHGVNGTVPCSRYVCGKGGIMIWEIQATDGPSVPLDRPEYEPRGCPRGSATDRNPFAHAFTSAIDPQAATDGGVNLLNWDGDGRPCGFFPPRADGGTDSGEGRGTGPETR